MTDIKRMDIKEFREKGYLLELNRRFLHSLGLALEVRREEDDKEILGGIWDYREDPEGIFYDIKNSEQDRIDIFRKKKEFIDKEFKTRKESRIKALGFEIEPIL